MPNRREIIRIGVAASAWPLASAPLHAAWSMPPAVPIYKIVFDRRLRHSVEFAERARTLGIAAVGIDGDMTRAWYDDIHWEWRRGGTAIAGLTEHAALFCFDQLARDYGMRVVFRGEHRARAGGSGTAHEIRGSASMLDACRRLALADEHWPALIAEAVAGWPIGRGPSESTGVRVEGRPQGRDADSLYSWVIAPSANSAHYRGLKA